MNILVVRMELEGHPGAHQRARQTRGRILEQIQN